MRISRSHSDPLGLVPKAAYAAFFAVLLIAGGARILAVFTLYVQTDEFVLLQHAVLTERTGAVLAGGRPGLATLMLGPLAADCRNAVDTVVQARLLWTAVFAAAGIAFWFLLRGVLPEKPERPVAVATGVGLWVLSAPVLYASTQVRTDQPAILFGLLGGVALLASRRRIWWAPVGGLLLGLGFLFSQKLLYVAGLVAVMVVGQLAIRDEWRGRRDLSRAALALVAFVVLLLGYRELMETVATAPTLLPISAGLSDFDYYRRSVGWENYRRILPFLGSHGLVLSCLLALTYAWIRDRGRHTAEMAVAWSVVAIGLAVLLFHAGRFLYFYMVLGLFPAAVGALIMGPCLNRLSGPRQRSAFLMLIWLPLMAYGIVTAGILIFQPKQQQQQRASLEWVDRNFPPEAVGFTNWAAFACRQEPWPTRFGARLAADFGGDLRDQHAQELITDFRKRPVEFMIPPIEPHPRELEEFWDTRYIHYYGGIHVPGRKVRGGPGWTGTFDVIVPGAYRWLATPDTSRPLEVGGRSVKPGEALLLKEQRVYSLRLPDGGEGMLVFDLPDPPAPDSVSFFNYPRTR